MQHINSIFQFVYNHHLLGISANTSILDSVKNYIARAPQNVVTIVPFVILVLVLMVVVVLLFKTRSELEHNDVLRAELQYYTQLANDKSEFLRFVASYLRAPLNTVSGGVEMAKSDAPSSIASLLESSAQELNKTVDKIVTRIENDQELRQIQKEPVWQGRRADTMRSRYFVIPVFVLFSVLVLFNGIFFVAGNVGLNYVNLAIQTVIFGLIVKLLYATLSNQVGMRHENERLAALTKFQRRLDSQRSTFIHEAQYSLMYAVIKLQESLKSVSDEQYKNYVLAGIAQYNSILGRLRLVSQLENSKLATNLEPVHVNGVIADAIKTLIEPIQAKRISVEIEKLDANPVAPIDTPMLLHVICSLLGNAIDNSLQRTRIVIGSEATEQAIELKIIDRGKGMSPTEVQTLFKPPTQTNNLESIEPTEAKLRLFISRMIAHAFHGELSVESAEGKGTAAILSLPGIID